MAETTSITRQEETRTAFAARLREIAARQNRVAGRDQGQDTQDPVDRFVSTFQTLVKSAKPGSR